MVQEGTVSKPSRISPQAVYTHRELEQLLGAARALEIFQLREAVSRIHPSAEEIATALEIVEQDTPLPTPAAMRAAAPVFVAYFRTPRESERRKGALREWLKRNYPVDYEAAITARSGGKPRRHRRRLPITTVKELATRGLKWCASCAVAKPWDAFRVTKSGTRYSYCIDCTATGRWKQHSNNRERPVLAENAENGSSITVGEGAHNAVQAR